MVWHSRGLPIDRYYLDKFISKIRPSLHGRILEIGGSKELSAKYNFAVETHATLDLAASADYVVMHQSNLFSRQRAGILSFASTFLSTAGIRSRW